MRVDFEPAQQINSFDQLGRATQSSNSASSTQSQYLNEDAYKLELSPGAQFSNSDMNELYKQIQDSTSLLQTAEQGASETESLLSRIHELVEKASSEELGDTERAGIQQEIDQLVTDIDRIAQFTQEKIKKIQENATFLSGSNQLKLANMLRDLSEGLGSSDNNDLLNAFSINCGKDSLNLKLQIGANPGQRISLDIREMNSDQLGLAGIDVTTHEKAVKAIKTIDKSIESVSSQRAGMRATIRCLQHTINHLTSMRDNLAEAESRIRDVDIAKEYSEYLKHSIQSKIAGAMLAHANQRPKMILKLLEMI